jgi:hypothetical protein
VGNVTFQRKHILGLGIAALVFILDQLIKWLMTGPLQLQAIRQIVILPFFNLTWTENYGVSLGLLTADSNAMRWGLVALTGAIAVFVAVWLLREKKLGDITALALVRLCRFALRRVAPVPHLQPGRCGDHYRRPDYPCPFVPFARKARTGTGPNRSGPD